MKQTHFNTIPFNMVREGYFTIGMRSTVQTTLQTYLERTRIETEI